MLFLGSTLTVLIAAIVLAVIFLNDFRRDMLDGESEAKIFGVLTVQGAIFLVALGILVAGAFYSFREYNKVSVDMADLRNKIDSLTQTASESQAKNASAATRLESVHDGLNSLATTLSDASKYINGAIDNTGDPTTRMQHMSTTRGHITNSQAMVSDATATVASIKTQFADQINDQ